MKPTIVYGPQGCGKTRNALKIVRHIGAKGVVDDFDFLARSQEPLADGFLYLSSLDRETIEGAMLSRPFSFSGRYNPYNLISYETVMAEIARSEEVFGEPVQQAPMPAAASGAQREKLRALPYDLVPFQEIVDAYVPVAEHGGVKYEPWNWTKGLSRTQIIGSMLRHTFAYLRGEERDRDSGLPHTGHILWNAVALVHNAHWNLEDGRRSEPERAYKGKKLNGHDNDLGYEMPTDLLP